MYLVELETEGYRFHEFYFHSLEIELFFSEESCLKYIWHIGDDRQTISLKDF